MATLTTTTALSIKLVIDTKSQRVLFAEAGKDVVDFLFSLLDLPLATVVSLVGTPFVAGSAGKLHTSAEFEARLRRRSADAQPVAAMEPTFSPAASLFFMPASSFQPLRIFFRCRYNYAGYGDLGISIQHCCLYMTDVGGTRCPNCGTPMWETLQHVSSVDWSPWSAQSDPTSSSSSSPAAGAGGSSPLEPSRIFFRCTHQYSSCTGRAGCNSYMADVKGTACPRCRNPMTDTLYYVSPAWDGHSNRVQDQEAATYTVLDDLTITQNDPSSPISTDTRLGRLGITDLSDIKERTMRLGYFKGLQILNALMHSKTVLTDAFKWELPPSGLTAEMQGPSVKDVSMG